MFAGTLAMLHRALRLDSRLLRTHLFRVSFAGLMYLSLLYAWASSTLVGAPGLRLFETMTYLNLVLISLAGISFFATAITEEKEEDTLGLLMLAGINPVGILLGKSTSRLLGTILLLLVQLPFTLLAITLGGVTLEQVLAAYCSLMAFMVLLANVGLLSSVVYRRGGSASAATLLFLICYFSASWVVAGIQFGLVHGGVIASRGEIDRYFNQASHWCRDASVFHRLQTIMQTGFVESPLGFQVTVSLVGALLFFIVAWTGFHHFTRDSKIASGPRVEFQTRFIGMGRSRRSRPGRRPVAWKEYHFVAGGLPVQIAKFVIYGGVTGLVFWAADRYYNFPLAHAGQYVVWAMQGVIVLEASMYASVMFHDEWRDRTLPVLAMLPVKPATILTSKMIGCLPAFIPALFWLLAGCAIWPDGLEELSKCLILPSRWFYAIVLLLFLTLTIFFSMVVRWGALPLALAVMAGGAFVSSCCGWPILGMMSSVSREAGSAEAGFLMVDGVIATLIFGLQYDVRRRLEIASSQ
ncbi:MAG TPA: ABC transporter permease [Planctomycetaceae bacterium]|jgi:ABC-type transport system involved in multi-copper enzyme maturation permease subunit